MRLSLLLLISLSILYAASQNNDFIYLTKDFLVHENYTKTATGLLCWKTDASVKLLKLTSSHGISMNIVNDCRIEDFNVYWHHRHLFILDFSCDFAVKCLEILDQHKLFAFPNKWLMFDNGNSSNDTRNCNGPKSLSNCPERYFSDIHLLSDSDLVVGIKDENNDNIQLKQYYKHRVHFDIITENYGYWNRDLGVVDMRSVRLLSMRRKNTNHTEFTASFVITNNNSMNHLTDYKDKHIDSITKSNYALTNYMIEFLNGTKNFTYATEWGFQASGNKWVGMIGQLVNKEVDIGGTPMFFLPYRIPLVEHIGMTSPSLGKFVFRQPPLSFVNNIFILPFRWTVWSAAFLVVIFTCFALYFTTYWEKSFLNSKINESNNPPNQYTLYHKWGEVIILAIGAVSQQGSFTEPRSLSGRVTTIMLLIAVMFLFTSYSANIVALLQSESHNIKTLSDLVNSRLKLGVEDTQYNRFYFPRYSDPVRKAIWDKKVAPKGSKPNYVSLEEGVREMQKGFYAFHMEIGIGYKFVSDFFQEDEKCGLYEIHYLEIVNPWNSIQKNSSFKEPLKIGMRTILQTGVQSREFKKIYTPRPVCSTKSGKFVSVGLIEIGPALIWFGIGAALAIILFLFEQLSTKMKMTKSE